MRILLASSSSGSQGRRRALPESTSAARWPSAATPSRSGPPPTRAWMSWPILLLLRRSHPLALHEHVRPPRALARQPRELVRRRAHRARMAARARGRDPREQAEPRGRPRSAARRALVAHAEPLHDPPHAKRALPEGALRAGARLGGAARARRYRGLLVTVLESRQRDLLQFPRRDAEGAPGAERRAAFRSLPARNACAARSARSSASGAITCSSSRSAAWCRKSGRCFFSITRSASTARCRRRASSGWAMARSLADWDAEVARRGLARWCSGCRGRWISSPSSSRPMSSCTWPNSRGCRWPSWRRSRPASRARSRPICSARCRSFTTKTRSRIGPKDDALDAGAARPRAAGAHSGSAARRLAEHEFSYTKMAEHYETLYQVSMRSEA